MGLARRPGRRAGPSRGRFRLAHWVNVPVLVILAASGLQILAAYPTSGRAAPTYDWYPFGVPSRPSGCGWAAGWRRRAHCTSPSPGSSSSTGSLYLAYLLAERRVAAAPLQPRCVTRATHWPWPLLPAPAKRAPRAGPLQRPAASGVHGRAGCSGCSRCSRASPSTSRCSCAWLAALFGGYDPARVVALPACSRWRSSPWATSLMVALHPRALGEMVTEGGDERAGCRPSSARPTIVPTIVPTLVQ